jgi:hypothetical protein
MEKLEKTLEEWKAMLDPEQYNVCRLKGTERPFSGKYNGTRTDGSTTASAATSRCSTPGPSSIPDAAGRVSMRRSATVR